LRHRDQAAVLWIVGCSKLTYFVDSEMSFNIETDRQLLQWKEYVSSSSLLTIALPLALTYFVESKINRLYSFGKLHTLMSHSLTTMLAVYFGIAVL